MKKGISGYLPVRDIIKMDYCAVEVVKSMLPVCDELIISDGGSTDGTIDLFLEWMQYEPKLRMEHFPWPNVPTFETVINKLPGPPAQPRLLVDWLNFTRQYCVHDMQLTSDADEVLDPNCYDAIREAAEKRECRWFHRLHFWKDAQHLTREGAVVGTHVARLGPTEYEMVSDEMRPEGEPPIKREAKFDPRLRFFHYGFIRKQEAFFAKSKVVAPWICNDYDKRLLDAEARNVPWTDTTDIGALVPFTGQHPELMHQWLRDRGYTP